MIYQEIGSIEALLTSITTLKDGSCKISFEVNPENIQVINTLMSKFLIGQKLFTLGIVQCDENRGGNDE
ncbi:MAG: hypothetical protein RL463_383 [Bacteroidota bacterium]|jgi:hypothetical protein